MKKVIVVAIRYSVLFSNKTKGFHLSAAQDEYESYKKELFSDERMQLRESLFENFTLKSLNEVDKNKDSSTQFVVVVMASTELPDIKKQFLEKMKERYKSWLCLQYIEPGKVKYGDAIFSAIGAGLEEGQMCATVRLDDDDALFKEYANVLNPLMKVENNKSIVSFSLGYNIYMAKNGKKFVGASEYRHSKNSAGLAYIQFLKSPEDIIKDNIYTCGNHIKIDEGRRLLEVDDVHGFIRVNTETSDRMYRVGAEERMKRLEIEYRKQPVKVKLSEVASKFTLDLFDGLSV